MLNAARGGMAAAPTGFVVIRHIPVIPIVLWL